MPGFGEILLVLLIVVLVFGATRIPEIARSLGKGVHAFKKASKENRDDEAPRP